MYHLPFLFGKRLKWLTVFRGAIAGRKQVAFDPSDELKPLPGDKARVVRYSGSIGGSQAAGSSTDAARTRAREERIGIGR